MRRSSFQSIGDTQSIDVSLSRDINSKYDDVKVVADNIADVTTLADNISSGDLVSVLAISAEITTVAGIEAEVVSLYNDKATLDSLYADKATLDSLYADKLTLDSLYADKATLDSLYADKITLDGLYADKAKLDSIFADKVTLDSLFTDKVTLDSLYADKAKLDSLYADKTTLDSLYADKATLDSIFADKSKLDSLFNDKVVLDSLYADKATLDSLFADKLTLDAIYANEANISIVASNIGDVNSYANSYYSSLAVAPTIVSHPTLSTGDMYFDTVLNEMRVYDGTVWKAAGSSINGTAKRVVFTSIAGQTVFTVSGGYDAGYADVYWNGMKLTNGVDVDVSSGTDITFLIGSPAAGDVIDVVAYGTFVLADHYTKAESDALATSNRSDTPVLSGATTVVETTPINITIDNYVLADENVVTYYMTSTTGTPTRTNGIITIVPDTVVADEAGHTLTVTAAKDGFLESTSTVHTFTVTNASIQNDADYAIASTGGVFNATNYPVVTGGYVDTTVGYEGLVATLRGGDGASNPSIVKATDTMTSNTTPNGVVTASSIAGAVYDAWKAFDDDSVTVDNGWVTNSTTTGWITYEFPVYKVINKYIVALIPGSAITQAPSGWNVYGSNTGVFGGEEDVLDTVSATGWSISETRTYTLVNSTSYKFYRISISGNGGGINTGFGEIKLIEAQLIPNSTFTSLAVAKADAQGDWNGTQAGASIVSELPDRLSSADATTAVIDGEILPTDKIYLGDGTNFAEVVDAGASYDGVALKTTITHGQAFTPTFACSGENTGLKVSADNGVTKYPLVKSGSSFGSLSLVSSVDPFMDGGLVAKYLLDGNVNDITGNHNGSLTGGTYTAGKFGNALKLLNAQYVSTPTSILGSLTDFTFSTFFKTTKASGVQCRFMWDGVPGSNTYQSIYLQDNILHTGNYNFAVGASEVLTNANDGLWHHIALTRVEGTGAINVYFDGVLKVFTISVAGSGHVSSGNTHNPIGSKNYPDTDHIQYITEYYNRVLTQSEVTELYNQGNPTIQETFDAQIFPNTGTNLVHEVTHKEVGTKTTAINVGLTELA